MHKQLRITMQWWKQSTIEELKKLDSAASECVESFNEVQAAEEAQKLRYRGGQRWLRHKNAAKLYVESSTSTNRTLIFWLTNLARCEDTAWDAKIQALKDEAESQHTCKIYWKTSKRLSLHLLKLRVP